MPERAPDHNIEAKVAPKQRADSEQETREIIDALTALDGNPEALSARLDEAIQTANEGAYGEAVSLITYGGNHLSQMLEQSGMDPAQCEAIRGQYNALVNPEQFEGELALANTLQQERILGMLKTDAHGQVDHRFGEYNSILDERIQLYEADIDASKANKEILEGELNDAQDGLNGAMEAFDKDLNYGLTAEKALTAGDQELFAIIYGAEFADKPEPTTEAERDVQRKMIRTRRDWLKEKIAPLKQAEAQVHEIQEKITRENTNIEANKQWIAQTKEERREFKDKHEEKKKAIEDGTYIADGKTEPLFAAARRLAMGGDGTFGGHGREEFSVIQTYATLAGDTSQTLLQNAAGRKLDRIERQLVARVDRMDQALREFGNEDPQMADSYRSEQNRLRGMLYKINPAKHTPPDLPMA